MGRRLWMAIALMVGMIGATPALVAAPVRLTMAGCAAIMPGAALPCLLAGASQAINTAPPKNIRSRSAAEWKKPTGMAIGPDGNIWFLEANTRAVAWIAIQGATKEIPLGAIGSAPVDLTTGPDGNLWFVEFHASRIGRVTTKGVVQEFQLPERHEPVRITLGPDKALWFTEMLTSTIGRITPTGDITEIALDTARSLDGITTGPDKALWFTAGDIGRITVTHQVAYYPLPKADDLATDICTGPDGSLWFTVFNDTYGSWVGKITVQGKITKFPLNRFHYLGRIVVGPDGALWFTEPTDNMIGQITTNGHIADYVLPRPNSGLSGVVAGPDGNVWFSERNRDTIGRITPEGKITEFPIPGGIGEAP